MMFQQTSFKTDRARRGAAIGLAVSFLFSTSSLTLAQMDHSQHQGHQHQMTAAQFAELREKVQLYRNFTDEQIVENMSRMRDLGGMISDAGVTGDIGILALAHGYTDEANQQWMEKFASISQDYPTGYGLGMAMMNGNHIQKAIDGLEAAGAKTILVLRTEMGDVNRLNFHWQYLFGLREEASYLSAPRIETDAEIVWGPSPTAHPIMGEIMLDYAKTLSTDPSNELVVMMGHGAMTQKENDMDLAIMGEHAEIIKTGGGFADVKFWNVQDDLPADQRSANVTKIRGWISNAKEQGMDVIVVTNALTQSILVSKLQEDVSGLDVKFSDRGLMQSPRFAEWISAAVDENLP